MSETAETVNTTAAIAENTEADENRVRTKRALPALLTIFLLGTLMIQAFNLVFQNVGDSLGMSANASLISTLPGIVLGVVCMLYGTLCDYISPRKMTLFGVGALIIGSLLGFFGASNFWAVVLARMIQTAGGQVAGSVFLVMAMKYLSDKERAFYLGVFNAVYYASSAVGIFAGGLITSIDWKYLFLVPLISVLLIPQVLKNTPDTSVKGERIDAFGIALFALIAGFVAIYFSFPAAWMLAVLAILIAVFAVYVWKGSNPFLSRKFVTNGAYMSVLLALFVFYFFNFACVPIYNVIGDQIYQISLKQVSICLTIVYLVATLVGCVSGSILSTIGRLPMLVLSAALMIVGSIGSAIFISSGFWTLTALACVFIAGITMSYTPLYDSFSATLPVDQNGRGIGIGDLMMNTSASIGMAVYSGLMSNQSFGSRGFLGVEPGAPAQAANMFWVMGLTAALALVIVLIFHRNMSSKAPKNQ
ncbi:MFS transporter, putative The Tet38 tetracycline-resistance protein [Bifidobacterium coryneforme]|uniref:MFS transporter, putative The Tet38 tetracycline-resistance protein n=1 Tax=Bifidobacterium coryneforme TaxID=1687 RepID=A0ABD4AC30_9BIFI|nr:MFS transporter [Bifidobacterium coryneforme]KJY52899.1 MFS transporter, putative The Tet38 tetracycline-resistance protein [Bifidobacterium coryneforme]